MRLWHKSWNVGNLLVALGIVALALSLWVPHATAKRVARIEGRAEDITKLLADILREDAIAIETDGAADRIIQGARDRGMPWPLEPRRSPVKQPGAPARIDLVGKHYCYRITREPQTRATLDTPPAAMPLEVYGWPRSVLGPARTVFFFAADQRASYTRNLGAGYTGWGRAPQPGAGAPREDTPWGESYRGSDDERWIALPGPG